MKHDVGGTGIAARDDRGFSQAIFVLAGLGIIAAGLWTLYMGDAPYHPDDSVSRDAMSMVAD